jgi:hypothetical protein
MIVPDERENSSSMCLILSVVLEHCERSWNRARTDRSSAQIHRLISSIFRPREFAVAQFLDSSHGNTFIRDIQFLSVLVSETPDIAFSEHVWKNVPCEGKQISED